MSTTQQLLSKAMSTGSEDEAIACLRMARKRGGTIDFNPPTPPVDVKFNGKSAKEWYGVARNNYESYVHLKNRHDRLNAEFSASKKNYKKNEEKVDFYRNFAFPVCSAIIIVLTCLILM